MGEEPMRRIANTIELQAELHRLLGYAGSRRPSRVRLAAQLASLSQRVAGVSYGSGHLSVVFTEGRRLTPFNIDVIRQINNTWIPIVSDEGVETEANLKFRDSEYSEALSHYDEQAGLRHEVRVDVEYPLGEGEDEALSERRALSALTAVGKKFGFSVRLVLRDYHPRTVQTQWKARARKMSPAFGF